MAQHLILWVGLLLLLAAIGVFGGEIYDPAYVFCGTLNCYDVLGLDRTATIKDIKKAFRKLSLTHHPDKSKADNATEVFRIISKAYEVLEKADSRELFDYYLDHPRDYFRVSGQHYFKALPKHVQYSNYERALKYLKYQVLAVNHPQFQSSPQAIELFNRSRSLYDVRIKEERQKDRLSEKMRPKMQDDPLFHQCIDEVVAAVNIEGGYRKPEWKDLFAFQLLFFPYTFYKWCCKIHRRYISSVPLSLEEKYEMVKETVGLGTWDSLTQGQKDDLVAKEIWRYDVQDRLQKEAISENIDDDDDEAEEETNQAANKKAKKKLAKKAKKDR